MKIVYVTPRVPYPPNRGDKIRSYHILRHLCRDHEVHVVSLVDRAQDLRWSETLEEMCASVSLRRIDRIAGAGRALRSLSRGDPMVAALFAAPRLRRTVREVCANDTDVLWIYNGALYPNLTGIPALRTVVDLVDVDSDKWLQMAAAADPLRAALYHREARATRAQEDFALGAADACIVVSAEESRVLNQGRACADSLHVVGNGVDLASFPANPLTREPTILFTGVLDYAPNIDAVLHFAADILPLVRSRVTGARFVAAGGRPPRRLLRAARDYRFEVVADVDDIRPHFAAARVFVAPMRLSRGVLNKILEAMASGVPVVATPRALVGHAPWHEEIASCAGTPGEFADACVALLTDDARAERMAAAALRFVSRRHRWDDTYASIDAILSSLCGSAPARAVAGSASR